MRRTRPTESGLTLIELVISVVLLSMIAGALSTVFVTALGLSGTDKERVKQSDDSQTISAFLVRDAQAAGGTDPSTASLDTSLGVSKTDDAGCASATPGASLRLRFKWLDRSVDASNTQISTAHVANYYWVSSPTSPRLERTTCDGGGLPSTTALGSSVASVTAACFQPDLTPPDTPCDAAHPLPDTVSLTMTSTPNPPTATYQYTVTASLRPEGQTPPCAVLEDPSCPSDSGSSVPLLTLGGGVCASGAAGASVSGSTTVHIYGAVVIDTANAGGCPAMLFNGHPTYTSGAVSILNGGTCTGCPFTPTQLPAKVLDPFAGLTPPADTCGTGTNPGTTSVGGVLHYHPGTYPTLLSVSTGAVFDTGNYIFCAGVGFSGSGTVSTASSGVLFYIKGGTLTKSGGINVGTNCTPVPSCSATSYVPLLPQTTGPYAGLLIWQAAADPTTPMSFTGTGQLALGGTLYAPTIEVILGGTPVTSVRSVIAGTVTFTGNHSVDIGVPPPPLVIASPASLPNWTVGVPAYTPPQTVTVSGGSGFNTFTMGTGSPPGLGINSSTGLISGTPTRAGTYTFSVTDTDSFGSIASVPYTVTINGPLSITTASLPDWTVTRDYRNFPVSATGGTSPYTWSATGLPTGLSINAAGVIFNDPSVVGTFTPKITVTDNAGATASRTYTVVINPLPSITGPASLPNWTAGQPGYPSQTMMMSGGTAPFTWAASGLPTGQTINAGTGVISGTPTAAGTFSVAVTVTDTAGASATKNYTVTINPAPGIATASLPNAEVGQAYSFTLTPTAGGTPPYTWSLTAAPAWLRVNAGTGALSGTPPGPPGAPNVTVKVTDSTGASASKTYTLTIANTVSITGPNTLPAWTINRDYPGTQIIVANGVAPFTWSAPGLAASGLAISASGVISGTPSASGTFPVTVQVTDSQGATATKSYSLVINIAPTVSTPSLSNGEVNVGYSAPTMAASGGTAPFSWTANGLSAIGPTMAISANGVISGTPTATGSFLVTITAIDAAGASTSRNYTLTVNPVPVNNLSLGTQTGGASLLSGTTVYYHGAVAGTFAITNAITNASGTGPASTTFANLGGTSTGFMFAGSTVSIPSGGPYTSNTFSWTAGTNSSPTEVVTGTDAAGDTVSTTLTFVNDSTAPTGGALSVNGTAASGTGTTSTTTNTSFTIGTRTDYTDAGSGLASSTLTVQSATFTNNTCGAAGSAGPFTSPTPISGTTQPGGIVAGRCYIYTLTGTDHVGNAASVTTTVSVIGSATQIILSGSTANLLSGTTRTFTATIEDANGNTVTTGADSSRSVTFSKTSGAGSLTGLGASTASGGVATDTVTGNTVGSVSIQAGAPLTQGATNSNTLTFTVNPPPTVTSTNPNSEPKGASYTGIKIIGMNFASGATVSFSGGGITVTGTTFVSATEIDVNITITNGATKSARNVSVTNTDGGVGTGTGVFTVA